LFSSASSACAAFTCSGVRVLDAVKHTMKLSIRLSAAVPGRRNAPSCVQDDDAAQRVQPIFIEWVNQLPHKHLFAIDNTLHGAESDKPEVRTVVHLSAWT